jgi:hypothetical protein
VYSPLNDAGAAASNGTFRVRAPVRLPLIAARTRGENRAASFALDVEAIGNLIEFGKSRAQPNERRPTIVRVQVSTGPSSASARIASNPVKRPILRNGHKPKTRKCRQPS